PGRHARDDEGAARGDDAERADGETRARIERGPRGTGHDPVEPHGRDPFLIRFRFLPSSPRLLHVFAYRTFHRVAPYGRSRGRGRRREGDLTQDTEYISTGNGPKGHGDLSTIPIAGESEATIEPAVLAAVPSVAPLRLVGVRDRLGELRRSHRYRCLLADGLAAAAVGLGWSLTGHRPALALLAPVAVVVLLRLAGFYSLPTSAAVIDEWTRLAMATTTATLLTAAALGAPAADGLWYAVLATAALAVGRALVYSSERRWTIAHRRRVLL